jgi:hypothetical protein
MKDINCCECGVRIYFEDDYYDTLKNTKKTFYCLNGHSQVFISKTDAEIQKDINKVLEEDEEVKKI